MPSGPVRLALANVQDKATKGNRKEDMSKLDTLVKSQEKMKNAYPVKSTKK